MRSPHPDLSQKHLIEQLIKFTAFIPDCSKIPPNKLIECRRGLCQGFSILFAFQTAQNKGIWWKAVLETISQTPIEQNALSTKSHLPQTEEDKDFLTAYDILLRAAINIYANQNELQKNIAHLVQFYEKAAGNFSPSDIAFLLDEKVIQGKNFCLLGSITHACALRYHNTQWHFYDPNNPAGEIAFESKWDCISEIIKILGYSLCFQIMSLDPQAKETMAIFAEKFQQLCNEKPHELLESTGLPMIATYMPELLDQLLQKTTTNPAIKVAFCESLTKKNLTGKVGFSYLYRYQRQKLLELAKEDNEIKKAIDNAKSIEIDFVDLLQAKNQLEEILLPIATEIEEICDASDAIRLADNVFKTIPPFIEYTQLKNEYDPKATRLTIDEAYDPLHLHLQLIQHKKMTDNALHCIIMMISEKENFCSLIKLSLFDDIKNHIFHEKNGTLLHLYILLVEKIEEYLYDHPQSLQKNKATQLKLEILNAEHIENICTLLKLHLDQTNQSPWTSLFVTDNFDGCLDGCLAIAKNLLHQHLEDTMNHVSSQGLSCAHIN